MTTKTNHKNSHNSHSTNFGKAVSLQTQQQLINRQQYFSQIHQSNCMGLDVMMKKNTYNSIQTTNSNIS